MQVAELPLQYGPMSVGKILRVCVQSLIEAAKDPGTVLAKLPVGCGKASVSAVVGGKTKTVRLPPTKKFHDLWAYLATLMDILSCCDNFLSRMALASGCTRCKVKKKEPGPSVKGNFSFALKLIKKKHRKLCYSWTWRTNHRNLTCIPKTEILRWFCTPGKATAHTNARSRIDKNWNHPWEIDYYWNALAHRSVGMVHWASDFVP